MLGRDLERLVEGAGEDRLRAAEHGSHGLGADAHDVVVGLRADQRRAAAHHAEAEHLRLGILDAVTLLQQFRPQPPAGAELADLLKEIHVHVEEEAQTAGELLHIAAAADQLVAIGQPVGQRVAHLLDRRTTGVAHMGAGDADGVEARRLLVGEQDGVGDQAHRGLDREDPGAARHILLEDVVLDGARQLLVLNALTFRNGDIHGQQH